MKRMILLMSFIWILFCGLNAQTRLDIDYRLSYTDNAFNLSDRDLDRFKNNEAYSYLESSDDIVNSLSLRLVHSIKDKNYRLSPAIGITQNNYLNNQDKNSFSFTTGCNARIHDLYLDLRYGYYPQNYSQKYEDKDITHNYEKFEYEKNMYKLSFSYPITKKHSPQLYFKYENYYHNKYFVEYDGNALTSGIGWKYEHTLGDFQAFYYYRTFKNESDNKKMQTIINNEYDCSYDSDIYEFKYVSNRIFTNYVDYTPFLSIKYQNDYYLSEILPILDSIHSTRKDKRFNINIGSQIYFSKNINFQLDLLKEFRKVNSENVKLKDSKNYDKTQINCGISWSFDLTK